MLLLATLLNYMDRQALAVTLPTLKQQYNLGESRVGMVEGCFGIAFAVGSVLFGWLADRVGPRMLYPAVLTGWSLAGVATAWAGQPWVSAWFEMPGDPPGSGVYRWLLLCRIALGLCEAGHWPCALLTVRAILSAKDRTLGNGILQSGASIGAILVPLYVEAADRAGQSWEFPFWSIGLVGLAWVPLWCLLIGRHELSAPKADQHEIAPATEAGDLVRRFVVLAIVIATLTISWQFLRAWLALFLQDHHGYTKQATRGLMSGYFIAADVGCLLSGILVTRLSARGWRVDAARRLGFVLFTLLTTCGAWVPFVGDGWLMVALLFVTGGGILGLHPYYYAFTQELSATRMGVLSGALAAGGWVASSLAQILLGRHIEATHSYALGLVIVGLVPVVGLITLLVGWPSRPAGSALASGDAQGGTGS
ncbi:MAG: hypothetical protein A2V98_11775 [Planctomycetes bacterium RBG_16_64_12]|nr:MAG: hypothetical protein A2V98_11775 [Planctomycetes bacterium RBG_16_64_12]